MLRFIVNTQSGLAGRTHFNTSHVKVYPNDGKRVVPALEHFNTSHVKVYLEEKEKRGETPTFQYISC